jgi:hypothetical protein
MIGTRALQSALLIPAIFCMSVAQNESQPPSPCRLPEARQFDFWIGEWDVTWGEDGSGTNTVTLELDSCVIVENFDGNPTFDFRGRSFSSYNPETGKWEQTWVDNNGGYITFVGEYADGKMELRTRRTVEGEELINRMVFYNIAEDSLDWDWEKSTDDGKTWELLWRIHYTRR